MWVFTDVADWYDKQRKDNATWLENVMDKSSYDFLGAAVYTLAGAAWLLNAIPGAIGGGFIDTARLGDGVKEGGWGYGQDALRLLVLAGPALRAARYGLALVAAVDETRFGNCLWSKVPVHFECQGQPTMHELPTWHWRPVFRSLILARSAQPRCCHC